jgi:NADPH-dependent ferric siderophore reductase
MADQKTSRGFSGALVKLWRGGDYETVTGRTEITPNLRLRFTAKDLLVSRRCEVAPARLLVNSDPQAGTVDIDFAMHDGSNFSLPEPAPSGYVIVGDIASLPAINSLLDAIGDAPARVFLQSAHDDRELPVARDADVVWVDRKNAGEAVEAVTSSAFEASDHFGWVACDNRATRAMSKIFREDYEIPRKSIKAQAYWVA